jgi:hypothetical protein
MAHTGWQGTGKNVKPLIFFGGCNCEKGKHLGFCRASNSQCGGQGFDPPSAPPFSFNDLQPPALAAVFANWPILGHFFWR